MFRYSFKPLESKNISVCEMVTMFSKKSQLFLFLLSYQITSSIDPKSEFAVSYVRSGSPFSAKFRIVVSHAQEFLKERYQCFFLFMENAGLSNAQNGGSN